MLYPKNISRFLDDKLFQAPTREYRGAPFWAWNGALQKDRLLEEIEQMKEMGMGGFHIHSRQGMQSQYLGPEYMEMLKVCLNKAKQEDMLFWLYDEAGWPSGFAGGYITEKEKYRIRYLVFAPAGYPSGKSAGTYVNSAKATRNSHHRFLAAYAIKRKEGCLQSYRRLPDNADRKPIDQEEIWEAFLEISSDTSRFNHRSYGNVLDREAVGQFLHATHERFFQEFGADFGTTIPAVFTDEPQLCKKGMLSDPDAQEELLLPYTDSFDETYRQKYGMSFLDILPEIIWELPNGKVSPARYFYHDRICEEFSSTYCDTLGEWCDAHRILLTGHLLNEDSLYSQTRSTGDVMRSYRAFQLPGIDILSARPEFTTAKQAQSVTHQYGRPGVLCEIYGATGWRFRFQDYKLSGDWLAALGVTVRVHHLNWMCMSGEAKRDYPASIGSQSPWYREFPLIEDHFSRIATALTRGKPIVRVGVIHPIESYWLHWGPNSQTSSAREDMENNFQNITRWLLFGLIDFDFLCEALLPVQKAQGPNFTAGAMSYDAVVVPACETLRRTTVERLETFQKQGGKILFVGKPPSLVDAVPNDRVEKLAEKCSCVPLCRGNLLNALANIRDIDVRCPDGSRSDRLFYQLREDSGRRWLFLSHVLPPDHPDLSAPESYAIHIAGQWRIKLYDTLSGEIRWLPSRREGQTTRLDVRLYAYDSLLLCLFPDTAEPEPPVPAAANAYPDFNRSAVELSGPVSFSLSEPNVCLLDQAEFSLDGHRWNHMEELLRIDRLIRKEKSWPEWDGVGMQPWEYAKAFNASQTVFLRFSIESQISVKGACLALELPGVKRITWNGTSVSSTPCGWFADQSIRKLPLPDIPAGRSVLTIEKDITPISGLEWCYLAGPFGVETHGRSSVLTDLPSLLYWNSLKEQRLPFYTGNIRYQCCFQSPASKCRLQIPHFEGELLSVELDGKFIGRVAFPPYAICLGNLSQGTHLLNITLFGDRNNAFGAVHFFDTHNTWNSPQMWHSSGPAWSYEYQLENLGILTAPRLFFG